MNEDDEPTLVAPRETMRHVIYGEGHAIAGPSRPTRNLRPLALGEEDISDGVPIMHDCYADTLVYRRAS